MNWVVCVKQVPEVADAELELTADGADIEHEDLILAINECDAYAVEEAVRLAEAHGGEVTAVTVGGEEAEDVLRRALAMGAHHALRIDGDDFGRSDALGIARGLAAAVRRLDRPRLVLTGAQSSDTGWGQVGPTLAELLGWPWATLAVAIDLAEGPDGPARARVQRELEANVLAEVEVGLPAVVTVQTGINQPRYVSVMGIRKVRRIAIEELDADDLEIAPRSVGAAGSAIAKVELTLPRRGAEAEMLEGSLDAACERVAQIVRGALGTGG